MPSADTTVYAPTDEHLASAVKHMKSGQPIAFPTETVYGLGAPARDERAVRQIFAIKGRPSTKPLIVHVATAQQAMDVVTDWPEAAQRLADAFWPGPLTLVLQSNGRVCDAVTAGGDTVAVRCPDHPVAIRLIEQLGEGIAAPSANPSGEPPPTNAIQVASYFGADVPFVLDGGDCQVQVPSTLVAIEKSGTHGRILREGRIRALQLAAFLKLSV